MCIYIDKKIGRGVVVAAHSHPEGRSPPGRWSWKVKGRNNQLLEVIIFSLFFLSLSLSPRIVAHYIEEIDSAEERRGGATRRSLNPGKEGPREERRGGFASSRHVARARSSVTGGSLRRKRRPLQRKRPHGGWASRTAAGPGAPRAPATLTEDTSDTYTHTLTIVQHTTTRVNTCMFAVFTISHSPEVNLSWHLKVEKL